MTEGCVIIRSEVVKALALRSDADLNEWAYFIILSGFMSPNSCKIF